jgi:hypothetical protein
MLAFTLSCLLNENCILNTNALEAVVSVPRVKCGERLVGEDFEPNFIDLVHEHRRFNTASTANESLEGPSRCQRSTLVLSLWRCKKFYERAQLLDVTVT